MARITVEDCLHNVENRFHLVLLASKRARQLMRGSVDPTVPWENDKATVVALREIANGHTDFSDAHQVTDMPISAQAAAAAALNDLPANDESTTDTPPEAAIQADAEANLTTHETPFGDTDTPTDSHVTSEEVDNSSTDDNP